MADKKISQLTAATTPLTGTEVLPIVQGTATVKVANNDLRPKQIQSNATSGVLQINGPADAATRVMTTPDADFTIARTDAANSFTADQTLATGNLVIGTSGKGIDFSATADTGTSELLADYEEGTWTPTLTSTGTAPTIGYSTQIGNYVKVGKLVHWSVEIVTSSATGGTGDLVIGGFPYVVGVNRYTGAGCAGYADNWTTRAPEFAQLYQGNSRAYLTAGGTTSSVGITVSNLTNGAMTLIMSGTYISA